MQLELSAAIWLIPVSACGDTMSESKTIRIIVTRAKGAPPEFVEDTARSLLSECNEQEPGSARFAVLPAEPNDKWNGGLTPELIISVASLASSWLVPAIQHWISRQPEDTGLVLETPDFTLELSKGAPPEIYDEVTSAIARVSET